MFDLGTMKQVGVKVVRTFLYQHRCNDSPWDCRLFRATRKPLFLVDLKALEHISLKGERRETPACMLWTLCCGPSHLSPNCCKYPYPPKQVESFTERQICLQDWWVWGSSTSETGIWAFIWSPRLVASEKNSSWTLKGLLALLLRANRMLFPTVTFCM